MEEGWGGWAVRAHRLGACLYVFPSLICSFECTLGELRKLSRGTEESSSQVFGNERESPVYSADCILPGGIVSMGLLHFSTGPEI